MQTFSNQIKIFIYLYDDILTFRLLDVIIALDDVVRSRKQKEEYL